MDVICVLMEHINLLMIKPVMLLVLQDIMKMKRQDFVKIVMIVVNNVMEDTLKIVQNARVQVHNNIYF